MTDDGRKVMAKAHIAFGRQAELIKIIVISDNYLYGI